MQPRIVKPAAATSIKAATTRRMCRSNLPMIMTKLITEKVLNGVNNKTVVNSENTQGDQDQVMGEVSSSENSASTLVDEEGEETEDEEVEDQEVEDDDGSSEEDWEEQSTSDMDEDDYEIVDAGTKWNA